MKNLFKNKKGITLISLVVTIVVLIILATISVTLVLGDNGILTQAKKARDSQANAIVKENQDMDRLLAQYNSELGIAKNPYEPDDWEYAWVYDDGAWGEMLTKGDKIEGGIAAKFYKTGKKVNSPTFEAIGLTEGDEYHLIIELIDGDGEMGALATVDEEGNPINYYAWQSQLQDFMSGSATTCIWLYVTEMVVCEGITNISTGTAAFGLTLKNVIIADTVTSIGDSAFESCMDFTSITIPSSVISIGDNAFDGCSSLANITIPNSVTSIGNNAFDGCRSLANIKIPNSVTSIGDAAFCWCISLTNITIPNSVTSIGDFAFYECESLTNITIPESVTSIESSAFSQCESLVKVKFLTTDATKITIPSGTFTFLPQDSKIYVLSEDMKTKLEGTYSTSRTTVEVVSAERMEEL